MNTHFVAAVVFALDRKSGEWKFLVIDYRSKDPRTGKLTSIQTKFPGGTNKECPDETTEDTCKRELEEETGLCFSHRNSLRIWDKVVSPGHNKCAFLVPYDSCTGQLRQEEIDDDGDKLSKPYWATEKELAWIFHSHEEIFKKAINFLHSSINSS
ncbi:MAG: hypothetical protein COV96_02575 [Candidatus Zambryskibacteria bacterium CG11_big_fil_rev_8_21_14_0_20_42_18]|uniref:Nudix hydrolase domain-containing protein n=1 Tax=Candidatus Zambryskibacteria bacterium CG_4_9_14_3_um_filter_42_15 TaxID=1975112 RepID=A0A2M7WSQ3_9BACT|nr:MAG: hypothetical protein COV96_02575 [Candidatus Zambryskibacteria bacterium CG11_big_fil_rev_8_21_14_0_20_42_18]PJA33029.1 MAG: hypothetical protein CO185_00805 [Candidatus Zambryskibacteria bacterium CG_4_9_14_3_um_filter_42_15]